MKRLTFLIIFILLSTLLLHAQQDKQKTEDAFQDLNDAMVEMEDNQLALYFFNALNGETITDAEVEIEKMGIFKSDLAGRVSFPIPEDGGFFMVQFKKEGFITSKFKVEIEAGTLFSNNRFSISPVMELNYLRAVVDWGKKPKDLDAHLTKYGAYHISYQDMHSSDDGYVVLDRDDRNAYGPETITIKKVDNNTLYKFYIHDYSHKGKESSNQLSKSKASVKVYGNGQLLQVFQITPHQTGNYWHVFNISQGMITKVNVVLRDKP